MRSVRHCLYNVLKEMEDWLKHKIERTNTVKFYVQNCQELMSWEKKLWLRKELNLCWALVGAEYPMCAERECIEVVEYECMVSVECQKDSEFQVPVHSECQVSEWSWC